jgi:acyl-coenzyme A thioesterase PaaI-like protein
MKVPNVVEAFGRVRRWPGGTWVFGRGLGFFVPYAGSIHPTVLELTPGTAVVAMKDRHALRNHLGSLHAAALMNLAELVGNLAVTTLQPADGRWILRGMDVDFTRKARGTITGRCTVQGPLDWTVSADVDGEVTLVDREEQAVLRARPRWRIGPVPRGA